MAKCLADSLIFNQYIFNPIDLRIRFNLWWKYGYNNNQKDAQSFGLGGIIKQSFEQFNNNFSQYVLDQPEMYTIGQDCGNGTIMRIAPLPIAYHMDIQKAENIAKLQSLTTHNGYESGEISRLITHLVIKLINYTGDNPKIDIFDNLCNSFKTNNISVNYLIRSQQEEFLEYNYYPKEFNKNIDDRYWDWKQKILKLSPTRIQQSQSYYGSYVMDCIYISLHISYHSQSIEQALLQAVNLGGDSDTIASVVGIICGAMYGIQKEILDLYIKKMVQFDNYEIIALAYKLFYNLHFD